MSVCICVHAHTCSLKIMNTYLIKLLYSGFFLCKTFNIVPGTEETLNKYVIASSN